LRVELEHAVDVREPAVCEALQIDADPAWIRDIARTHAVAGTLRHDSPAQALLVPSVAFVDQPERWNLVIFREKVEPYPGAALTLARAVSVIRPADILGFSLRANEPR
jgi:hypothetical protein